MVKNTILESIAWDRTPTSQTMYAFGVLWDFWWGTVPGIVSIL